MQQHVKPAVEFVPSHVIGDLHDYWRRARSNEPQTESTRAAQAIYQQIRRDHIPGVKERAAEASARCRAKKRLSETRSDQVTNKEIKPIDAEDAYGVAYDGFRLYNELKQLDAHKWAGRAEALEEISWGGIVEVEDIESEDDDIIASYLVLTRCDNHDELPEIACCNAIVDDEE